METDEFRERQAAIDSKMSKEDIELINERARLASTLQGSARTKKKHFKKSEENEGN